MLPYGRIFLNISSVVNSLKALLHEDSRLFHCGPRGGSLRPSWRPSLRGSAGASDPAQAHHPEALHPLRKGLGTLRRRTEVRRSSRDTAEEMKQRKPRAGISWPKETHPEAATRRRPRKTRSRKAEPAVFNPAQQPKEDACPALFSIRR